MHNGTVKMVSGIRRCGKTCPPFSLFGDYLRSEGVDDDHIIETALDVEENAALRGEYGVVTASVFDFLLDKDCLAGIEKASGGVGFVLSSTQASIIWVTPTMGATAWRAAESAREWTTRSSVDSNEISIVLTI